MKKITRYVGLDDRLNIVSMGAFESDGSTIFCRFCGEPKLGRDFCHHEDCLFQMAVNSLTTEETMDKNER